MGRGIIYRDGENSLKSSCLTVQLAKDGAHDERDLLLEDLLHDLLDDHLEGEDKTFTEISQISRRRWRLRLKTAFSYLDLLHGDGRRGRGKGGGLRS